jgi:ADP-ribose pyrophosphatase YjhB (NUDIX family)
MNNLYINGIEIGVVSLVLNDTSNEILVGFSKENRGWTLPGGHVEPGEKLEKSIIRETLEEIGIEIEILKMLDAQELIYTRDNGNKRHVIVFPFIVKIKSDQNINADNIEFSEVKWANFDEAEDILNKHYKKTIPELKKWLQEKK